MNEHDMDEQDEEEFRLKNLHQAKLKEKKQVVQGEV